MKTFAKLPFYLGLSVFVLSILVTSISIGQKNFNTKTTSQATVAKADLTLRFTQPDIVSVSVTSDVDISGVDIALNFDKTKISILQSSLKAGDGFTTVGGKNSDNIFSFSAITKENISSGIIATFNIKPVIVGQNTQINLQFILDNKKTLVLEKNTNNNILNQANGLDINLPSQ